MSLRDRVATVTARGATPAERALAPATLARWALGAMVLLAGVHKLLDPGAWTVYVVDWLAPWLVLSPVAFVLVDALRR